MYAARGVHVRANACACPGSECHARRETLSVLALTLIQSTSITLVECYHSLQSSIWMHVCSPCGTEVPPGNQAPRLVNRSQQINQLQMPTPKQARYAACKGMVDKRRGLLHQAGGALPPAAQCRQRFKSDLSPGPDGTGAWFDQAPEKFQEREMGPRPKLVRQSS